MMVAPRTHPMGRGLIAALLLAGLALACSVAFGQRGQGRWERRAEEERKVAPQPAAAPQTPAVRRYEDRGRVSLPAAPVPSPRLQPEVGRTAPGWTRAQPRIAPEPAVRERPRADWVRTGPVVSPETPARPVSYLWRTPVAETTPTGERPGGNLVRSQPVIERPQLSRDVSATTPYRLYRQPTEQQPAGGTRQLRGAPVSEVQAPAPRTEVSRTQPRVQDRGQFRDREQPRVQDRVQVRERVQDRTQLRDREQDRLQQGPVGGRAEGRRLVVPEASFRGPGSEERVKVVPAQERDRVRTQLQERVREHNRQQARPDRSVPRADVVGNVVPDGATVLVRDRISRISFSYDRVRAAHGAPGHAYLVAPRHRDDYWEGYWDGYRDGYREGRHRRGPLVVIHFYYPFYFSDPWWVGFYYPGYYPAIYHYWGWCPAWVHPARVYYYPVEYVYVPVTPYRYYYSGYGLDYGGAQRAVNDIRRAWLDSDIGPLAAHLTDRLDVRVYFDGEYAYTTSTEDYYAMTLDTLATTQTVAMDFDEPIWISSREVFYTGRHVFYDPEGERQVVYVSYRLRELGGEWYIVAVGSSLQPIQHQYRDFRYT